MLATLPPPVHWTTYVQTFMVISSTIGTFVYVYFTYHIMKWAVGQGKASVELAAVSVADLRRKRAAVDGQVAIQLFGDVTQMALIAAKLEKATPDKLREEAQDALYALKKIAEGWEKHLTAEISEETRGVLTAATVGIATLFVVNNEIGSEAEPDSMRAGLITLIHGVAAVLAKDLSSQYHIELAPTAIGKSLNL